MTYTKESILSLIPQASTKYLLSDSLPSRHREVNYEEGRYVLALRNRHRYGQNMAD
jgi:hypothetical protein